jgi:hypothetical protein
VRLPADVIVLAVCGVASENKWPRSHKKKPGPKRAPASVLSQSISALLSTA